MDFHTYIYGPYNGLPYFSKFTRVVRLVFDVRSLIKGICNKIVQPSLPLTTRFSKVKLNGKSGHIPLNNFANLVGKAQSVKCSECDQIEDVYHILVECVRVELERKTSVTVNVLLCLI